MRIHRIEVHAGVCTLLIVLLSAMLVGTCRALPLDGEAADATRRLTELIRLPVAKRFLSDEEAKQWLLWSNSGNRDRQLVGSLLLAWADDPGTLVALQSRAEKAQDEIVRGATSFAALVRSNRRRPVSEQIAALSLRLVHSANPYERMFVANRMAVDFPAQALKPIAEAARAETNGTVRCDMLCYLSDLADAPAAADILKWAGQKKAPSLPEDIACVMAALTPNHAQRECSPWDTSLQKLRAKAPKPR